MWVYVPSTTSASAPGEVDLISVSSWQIQALARSCWSRGKPSPAQSWLTRWSKAGWLRLLCGRMSEPSTAAHGVASWMASLAASRASPTPSLDGGLARTTSATSGQTLAASSSSPARGGASSRTSRGCSPRAAQRGFGETFPDWVSRLRADCSRRRKSARAMGGNGSSSSRWPTPAARDFKGANGADHLENGTGRLHLDQLPNFVAHLWSTPRASDGEKGGPNQSFGAGGVPLPAQASQWQTPSVADTTGGRMTRSGDRSGEMLLKGQAAAFSLRDQTTETPGLPSSTHPRTSRPQLNPMFVEWLMGWPIGSTAFGCSETGLSRYRQLSRTALSSLASPSAALPPQLSLFG